MRSDEISDFLQSRIDAKDFPSAVYLVAERGRVVYRDALGFAVVEPENIQADSITIYDLASLTKPLVTGLLTAQLVERKSISFDENVAALLVSDRSIGASLFSLRDIVTHTSGLAAWIPFYALTDSPKAVSNDCGVSSDNAERVKSFVEQKILSSARARDENQVVYSDLNFILLGFLLELLNGVPLDTLYFDSVVAGLGLQRTFFAGSRSLLSQIAASEKGNYHERQTCIELGYLNGLTEEQSQNLFRDYQIWGEVHDGNAWFMGGVAGHAGLFSTAEEIMKIALQFLPNYTSLLKPETTELFRTNFTPGMNEARSLAFQLAETPASTAGSRMSPKSFGHLGFTGTSLWIDPATERIFILLTNRTHAHGLPFVNINSVRRHFHDLANELLDKMR